MTIGEKIYYRRKELGLTIRELAQSVNVSHTTISRWESGIIENLQADKIEALASALHVSPLYLLGIVKETPSALSERVCNKIKKLNNNDLIKLEQMIDLMFKK